MSAIACMVLTIVLLAGDAFAASAADLRRIVVFHDGTSSQVQQKVVAQSGSRLIHVLSLINGVAIELPAANTQAALAFLQGHPAVTEVFRDPALGAQGEVVAQGAGGDGAGGDGAGGDGAGGDRVIFVTPVTPPSRELYPWGVDRIGAPDVQEDKPPVMGDGVTVAIFDTGIDRNHPDLAANIVGGFNAIGGANPSDYNDDNGHGTAMAGIIAARRNDRGVIGTAPRTLLYVVKVLDKNGAGLTSDTIKALEHVISSRPHIRVINMSYGTSLPESGRILKPAIQAAHKAGKIVVNSRGNKCAAAGATAQGAGGDGAGGDGAGGDGAGGDGAGGDGGCDFFAVRYPAAYPEVIAVGATTATDEVASYSLWGGVDVVAPGGDRTQKVLTTNVGGGYGLISGTSPAAAHVSGAVALALQLDRKLSFDQVVGLLQQTADHLECPKWPTVSPGCPIDHQGAGLIDVEKMVEKLKK